MIKDMVRIALWGVSSRKTKIIEYLHEQGVLHVETPELSRLSDREMDDLRLLRGKLLGMLEALEWDDWKGMNEISIESARQKINLPLSELLNELNKSLDHFNDQLSALLSARTLLTERQQQLHRAHEITTHFRSFMEEENLKGKKLSLWWIDGDKQSAIFSELRELIKKLSPTRERDDVRYHVLPVRKEENLVAISVEPNFSECVQKVLSGYGGISWHAPSSFDKENVLESVQIVEDEFLLISPKQRKLEGKLEETRRIWGPKLASLFFLTEEKLDVLLVERSVKEIGNAFLVEGWLPEDELSSLMNFLRVSFGRDVFLKWRYPTSDEWCQVPTALSNPVSLRPFELFLNLVQLPVYRGTDPTVMIGIFFPLFSGCMIGDIGYGFLIMLIGGWLFRKKSNDILSNIGYILITIATWSIIWGIAYGEFFGDVGLRLWNMHPLFVERSEAVMPVMVFSVVLGVVHIMLGLLLGLYEGLKNRKHHQWLEKLGNLVIILGLIFPLMELRGLLPDVFFSVGISFLLVGLILLIIGGGMGGLIEAFGTVGNILSYVRIAAIGLSSAILAIVASKFIDIFGVSILGIFMALSIHLLNFVLAIGGSGLHSARLHYVEFMGKFYKGGGREYNPFARRRGSLWKRQ